MDNSFEDSNDLPDGDESGAPQVLPSSAVTPLASAQTTATAASEDDRSSLITARGTAEGLVIRLDGRVEPASLIDALSNFVQARRSFLAGNDISLEWVGVKPEEAVTQKVSELLASEFSINVRSSKLKPQTVKTTEEPGRGKGLSLVQTAQAPTTSSSLARTSSPSNQSLSTPNQSNPGFPSQSLKPSSLFDGVSAFESVEPRSSSGSVPWDEPDARIFYTTLRSGQKLETEYSVIIFGDVNSGAEIIAGGDIVVLGTLRGIAHAGAYDESGGGRVIFCLNFQPTQLRIGTVISRGGNDEQRSEPGKFPEVARVENNMIVVEPYQSRSVWGRRRE